jgi:hypothetical protein
MKQNLQQTAVQKALQPIARTIKTGYEQFDILDTEDTIQQQADDNEAELEESQTVKRKREDNIQRRLEDELADPTQIGEMMVSSSSNIRGNLRGSSSSSAAAPQEEEEDDMDIQPKASQSIEIMEMNTLIKKTHKYLKHLDIEIKSNLKDGIHTMDSNNIFKQHSDIQNILTSINTLKTTKFKKKRTPQAIENLLALKEELTKLF